MYGPVRAVAEKRSEDEGGEVGISVNTLADLKDAHAIQSLYRGLELRPCGLVVRNCLIAIAVILLSPLFVGIGLLIKLNDGGPILHIARRMGRHGRTFGLFKFRTMVVGAAAIGPGVTGATDARVTRIGAFLRRTKLDELPQLVNVLRGEMELVGPRPEDPRYLPYYTRGQLRVLDVRPGITSPASIAYADESQILVGDDWESIYTSEVLPTKLDMELETLRERSLWEETREVLHTLWALAQRNT